MFLTHVGETNISDTYPRRIGQGSHYVIDDSMAMCPSRSQDEDSMRMTMCLSRTQDDDSMMIVCVEEHRIISRVVGASMRVALKRAGWEHDRVKCACFRATKIGKQHEHGWM